MRIAVVLVMMAALAACTQAFFRPHRVLVHTPDALGLAYEPMEMRASDGVALYGWFLPARGQARATVLHLHGNAENISTHFLNVAWMPEAGFNVLALDYRGYGRSGGSPSLAGMQLDIEAAIDALLQRPDVDAARIVVFGQSLGGALAIHYAAHGRHKDKMRALVVDSAFSDYRKISQQKLAGAAVTWPMQWLPSLTVDNDFTPARSVRAVSPTPILFIHGDRDEIVPVEHSRRLFALAAEPKELWVVPGAGHIQSVRDGDLRTRLTAFLLKHAGSERVTLQER